MYGKIGVKYLSAKKLYGLLQLSPMKGHTTIKDDHTGQGQAGIRLPDFNNSVGQAASGFSSITLLQID